MLTVSVANVTKDNFFSGDEIEALEENIVTVSQLQRTKRQYPDHRRCRRHQVDWITLDMSRKETLTESN